MKWLNYTKFIPPTIDEKDSQDIEIQTEVLNQLEGDGVQEGLKQSKKQSKKHVRKRGKKQAKKQARKQGSINNTDVIRRYLDQVELFAIMFCYLVSCILICLGVCETVTAVTTSSTHDLTVSQL